MAAETMTTLSPNFLTPGNVNDTITNLTLCQRLEGTAPRPLTGTVVDYFIQHYIFPVQFIFGVCGNCLNLLVLLSSSMKNQANIFLSAMAFSDLAFLFCMLPYSMGSFEFFYTSPSFKVFIYLYRVYGTPIANMFSIAATWLVLAVSIERFSGVRRPMHTRFQFHHLQLILLIGIIFVLAFMLTIFQHFEYDIAYCSHGHPFMLIVLHMKKTNPAIRKFVIVGKYVQSFFGCIIPVLVVAVLNVSLIYFLRKREIVPQLNWKYSDPEFRRSSDFHTFQKQERKVTITVLSIVTCFTVTHLPTLVPIFYELLFEMYKPGSLNDTIAIVNNLLVCGKVLNFVLFCTSSAHFRRRTMTMVNSWCINRRKKYSSMASSIPVATTQTSTASTGKPVQSIRMHRYRKRHMHTPSNISASFVQDE